MKNKITEKNTEKVLNLELSSSKVFWFKKAEKCKINMKNTKPTPRSISHKKPTKISKSFSNEIKPTDIKYIPDRYHSESILITLLKKRSVIEDINWIINNSLIK